MTAKVLHFTGVTKLDFPVDHVLERAKAQELEGVVLLGYQKNGEMYFGSTYADGGTVLWLLEHCKKKLLEVVVEEKV